LLGEEEGDTGSLGEEGRDSLGEEEEGEEEGDSLGEGDTILS
jgi:hypothetical protein